MTEEKVKKRGWVKNAAIVFLAILLALTFFSNTIMNMSLPEVATRQVSSGTITSRIRGNGIIEANETYEVRIKQAREVETVAAKVGNTVAEGDVLFILKGEESKELEEALKTLEDMEFNYRKQLQALTQADYAAENRDIELAQADLEEKISQLTEKPVTAEQISAAEYSLKEATDRVNLCEVEKSTIEGLLADLGGTGSNATQVQAVLQQINAKQSEIRSAQTALESTRIAYGSHFEALKLYTTANLLADDVRAEIFGRILDGKTYGRWLEYTQAYEAVDWEDEEAAAAFEELWGEEFPEPPKDEFLNGGIMNIIEELTQTEANSSKWQSKLSVYMTAQATQLPADEPMKIAYVEIRAAESRISALNSELSDLQQQYNTLLAQDNSAEYNNLKNRLATAENNLRSAQAVLKTAEEVLTRLQTVDSEWEETNKRLNDEIKTLERSIADMLFALEQKQKTDNKLQETEALNLEGIRIEISRQRQKIVSMREESVPSEYLSPVSGLVKSVSISPGSTTEYDAVLMTIEVADKGYSVSFSITQEQAKLVKVGDAAEFSSYYWGPQLEAVVIQIRNDPDNPRDRRLVTLRVTGEVESGSSVSLTLNNTRGQNYELIVPNSAVRTDSNGDFVLILTQKETPLGTRYVATRVDVRVIDSDEQNSALSGGLVNWDFVITSSNAPIEPGKYVRMAEGL